MAKNSNHFPTPFGALIGQKRLKARKSVRQLARDVGVTHVGLGDVERGKRLILSEKYWDALVAALPGLTRQELEDAAARSSSREVRPWEHKEGAKREFAARIAGAVDRLNNDEYSEEQLQRLLQLFDRLERRG